MPKASKALTTTNEEPDKEPVIPGTLDGALLFTVNNACEVIGVSRSKCYALIRAGVLKTVRLGGSTMITADSLMTLARDGVPVELLTGKPGRPRRFPLRVRAA